ncbi:Protein-disulfide isomerase [Thalassovita mediterranea]|jgi:predicted DsbA family dithiol-disulfide isomerase|uniref:Protein-disulfide isomerase n=2 Tax=Thalassovita mediterranea TaxID=340021 RepID=A0A0P1GLW3_9RHOB|nr:Protein-disulfide isomerase [Thalassovita mediterranea]SIS33376.1 Predicted dithiol-disulfide isomerase, DsbA family [Thalassovita mediterranea]
MDTLENMEQAVKLDILSDPICPWCYIGKTYLDRALEQRPGHPFVVEWHPFQLNPDMPADGMDRRAYLEGKFGGQKGAVQAYMPVHQHAEAAGIKINLEGIKTTPNTLRAHRLIHWAGLEGKQTPIVSALFKAYFVDGRDIGDVEVLADIADTQGMDAAVVRRLLQGDADAEEIQARDQSARQMGVSSVPTFIIASQHAVPGAQGTDLWLKVIDEIIENHTKAQQG